MGRSRLLRACWVTLALLAAVISTRPAQAQANFDRPGGDYQSSPVSSGDPADCALVCERDRRCRAWGFNYPTDIVGGALCRVESKRPPRVHDKFFISRVSAAGVGQPPARAVQNSLDR